MKTVWSIGIIFLLMLAACSEATDKPALQQADRSLLDLEIPMHFPPMKVPEDNPITREKVALGKRLFFDPSLSFDGSVSCASCHLPSNAFSDVKALSVGAKDTLTERNSPSLMNIGFHPVYMREGAVPTLELQVLSPLEGATEMAHNIVLVCEALNDSEDYREQFEGAFGQEANPFTVTRALAAYERTLIGGDAPFDAFLQGDSNALNALARAGYELFMSKRLQCSSCHSGPLLSSFELVNNGLNTKKSDPGLMRLTFKEEDRGKFKVPSLRNIALTAPYMHDGRFETLEEVLMHYNKGGEDLANQSSYVKPLDLTEEEKRALLAFFESLTEASGEGVNPDALGFLP